MAKKKKKEKKKKSKEDKRISKPIELIEIDKEEERTIGVLSEIDEILKVQGEHFMLGRFKETIEIAERIIEMAIPENLISYIKEQEELIRRLRGILDVKAKKDLETMREKLRLDLMELEIKFNNQFEAKEYMEAYESIRNAKTIIAAIGDIRLREKWENYEKQLTEVSQESILIAKAQNLIEECSELKENLLFDEMKLKLDGMIDEIKDYNLPEQKKQLEDLKDEAIALGESYKEYYEELNELEEKVKNDRENNDLESALQNSRKILQLAQPREDKDVIEKYSKILADIKKELQADKIDELKNTIKILNEDGLSIMKKGELRDSLNKFKSIKESLTNFLE